MLRSLKLAPWGVVILLTTLYAVSFLDRQIIALIADPIAQSLEISDTQVGILYGLGFGLLYSIIGIPAAHLIDRRPRIGIVAFGVLLWSFCTIGSGFAATYLILLLLRSGVAIGEAVLTPAAVSIIGDLFPIEKRALPMAIYASAGGIMYTGSFFVGGAVYAQAAVHAEPLQMEAWRITLVVVGIPGILLGSLFWIFTAEPPRQQESKTEDYETIRAAIDYVRQELRFYLPFYTSLAVKLMVVAGFTAWTPTVLHRSFGLSVAEAGLTIGLIGMIVLSVGSIFWPMLVAFFTKRGRHDALIICFAIAQGVGMLFLAVATLQRDLNLFLITFSVCLFCMGSISPLPPIAIQTVAPSRMRARMSSLQLLMATIGGVMIGPPLIALVSDMVFDGPDALLQAGFWVCLIFAPIAVLLMFMTRKQYALAYQCAVRKESFGITPQA